MMVMSASIRVRSMVREGEMQFGGRMGGGMGMSVAVWVRSTVWVRGRGGGAG